MTDPMGGSDRDVPPSLSGLFAQLARDAADLVRGEIRLAKAELHEKLNQALVALVAVFLGAMLLYAGLLVLLAAAVLGLWKLLPAGWSEPWIAALIVAVVVLLAGLALLAKARSDMSGRGLGLSRTAENLGRDERMLKEHVRKAS